MSSGWKPTRLTSVFTLPHGTMLTAYECHIRMFTDVRWLVSSHHLMRRSTEHSLPLLSSVSWSSTFYELQKEASVIKDRKCWENKNPVTPYRMLVDSFNLSVVFRKYIFCSLKRKFLLWIDFWRIINGYFFSGTLYDKGRFKIVLFNGVRWVGTLVFKKF